MRQPVTQIRASQVAAFVVRFALLYALLMAPWPGSVEAYGALYRGLVQLCTVSIDPERSVRVYDAARGRQLGPASMDTGIQHRVPPERGYGDRAVADSLRSSRHTGYMPTAMLLSLVLATPLPWRRRLRAAAGGFLLITAFVAFMPAWQILPWFDPEKDHLFLRLLPSLRPAWGALLDGLCELSLWMTPYYLAPIPIWLFASVRRDEWLALGDRMLDRGRRAGLRRLRPPGAA